MLSGLPPIFRLQRPSQWEIDAFLAGQQGLACTYAQVGATHPSQGEAALRALPSSFRVIRERAVVGQGEAAYQAARAAVASWRFLQLPWLEVHGQIVPLRAEAVVAMLAHLHGGWALNASRVVYLLEESGPRHRFGFAYGTLPGHAIVGEERLLVEWRPEDGRVWYDLLSFSQPSHWLARLGEFPLRALQARFAGDTRAALAQAVARRPRQL